MAVRRPSPTDEIILAFPTSLRPATRARSTILLGSIDVVRASDRWDRYVELLTPRARELLFDSVAGTWIPIDVALEHYQACDAVEFTPEQQVQNGRATFARAGATIFGTISRMAREVGVTPWTFLPHMQRFWDRGYDGGGISVIKTGPKDCIIEAIEVPLMRSPYYRNAVRGLVWAVIEMFCRKSFLSERPSRNADSILLRGQWV